MYKGIQVHKDPSQRTGLERHGPTDPHQGVTTSLKEGHYAWQTLERAKRRPSSHYPTRKLGNKHFRSKSWSRLSDTIANSNTVVYFQTRRDQRTADDIILIRIDFQTALLPPLL